MHENEGVIRMTGIREFTGYRVCLDCDRRVYGVNAEYSVHRHYMDGEVMVGCEGYRHRELENAVITHYSDYLTRLETGFLELFMMEGWEYIIDNLVHDLNDPDDFGPDEQASTWTYGVDDEEKQAIAALKTFFEVRMEEITGTHWNLVEEAPVTTIEDI